MWLSIRKLADTCWSYRIGKRKGIKKLRWMVLEVAVTLKNSKATTTTSLEEQQQAFFQKKNVLFFQNKTLYAIYSCRS
jgi:hypothetical protein